MNKVHFSTGNDNWSTLRSIYDDLNKEFNFDFDPCPLHGADGLKVNWGFKNFVNPPHSEIKKWIKYGYEQYRLFGKTVVFLIPSRTDTKWWHEYCMEADEIRFIKGRLKFGESKNYAPFPSCIVIFKGD